YRVSGIGCERPVFHTRYPTPDTRSKGARMPSDIQITVTERNTNRTASSGSKWEPIMGYSRAVRSGSHIAVTGTVGINADGTYAKSLGEQTRRSLAIIEAALKALGAEMKHVIRTRMFVTDVSQWEQVAQVHGEVFTDI